MATNIRIYLYLLPRSDEMTAKHKIKNESIIILENLIEKNTTIRFDELLKDIMQMESN